MGSSWTIFKRELRQYFVSPIAYLVAFAVLLLLGLVFNTDLDFRVANPQPPNGTITLSYFAFLMVFFAPLLTMRLFAEESREGTLELMMTMPLRDVDLVLGKFLGAWVFYSILLALTIVYQIILLLLTNFAATEPGVLQARMDIGPIFTGYIGIWLYGGATIAIGLLFSSITENQIIAGFLSMAVLLMLWVGDIAGLLPASIFNAKIVQAFRVVSFQSHYSTTFLRGVLAMEDVFFFALVMVVALFITTRLVESKRWR